MTYLIDTNCFIEPYQRYYSFDVCPGYWSWIEQQNQLGVVFSNAKVLGELQKYQDTLTKWADSKDATFFLPIDTPILLNYGRVIQWVRSSPQWFQAAKDKFADIDFADAFLIAHAMTHGHIIVTHELPDDKAKATIPLPTVAKNFGVVCEPLHKVLRDTGTRFVLV